MESCKQHGAHLRELAERFVKAVLLRLQPSFCTIYMHIMTYHVEDLVVRHGSLMQYCSQGVEAMHKLVKFAVPEGTRRQKETSAAEIFTRVAIMRYLAGAAAAPDEVLPAALCGWRGAACPRHHAPHCIRFRGAQDNVCLSGHALLADDDEDDDGEWDIEEEEEKAPEGEEGEDGEVDEEMVEVNLEPFAKRATMDHLGMLWAARLRAVQTSSGKWGIEYNNVSHTAAKLGDDDGVPQALRPKLKPLITDCGMTPKEALNRFTSQELRDAGVPDGGRPELL
eukprot:jgi/Tetstr1/421776/TSEL_012679.t1